MTADARWREWARQLVDKPIADQERELLSTDEANRAIVRGIIAELSGATARDPQWEALRRAYAAAAARTKNGQPTQLQVAQEMGFDTEQPVRNALRTRGITDWRSARDRLASQG